MSSSILWLLLLPLYLAAQSPEIEFAAEDADPSEYPLEELKRHPLDLNRATYEDLLDICSESQARAIVQYRAQYGNFLSIHELQAIIDPEDIRRISPYIKASSQQRPDHLEIELLGRIKQNLDTDRPSVYTRLRLTTLNGSRLELRTEHDAGEAPLDFCSGYLWFKGKRRSTVIGDYELKIGQALLLWSGFGFGKGTQAAFTKKSGRQLKPYTGLNEERFFRGAASSLKLGTFQLTPFVSFRQRDARLDTLENGLIQVRTMPVDGYHISTLQKGLKDQLWQTSYGLNVSLQRSLFQIGLTWLRQQYGLPLAEKEEVYRKYQPRGRNFNALSMDLNLNMGSLNVFGEWAHNSDSSSAILTGILWAAHNNVDMAILYRNYDLHYHSWYSMAFSSLSWGAGEQGVYYNLNIRPTYNWLLSTYIDIFKFNNATFQSARPGLGKDILLQLVYRSNKRDECLLRLQNRLKPQNAKAPPEAHLKPQEYLQKQAIRIQIQKGITEDLSYRARLELNRTGSSSGSLAYQQLKWAKGLKWAIQARYSIFQVDAWEARIYALEPGLPFSYSNSAYGANGNRLSLLYKRKLRALSLWLRISYGRETTSAGTKKVTRNIGVLGIWTLYKN